MIGYIENRESLWSAAHTDQEAVKIKRSAIGHRPVAKIGKMEIGKNFEVGGHQKH